MVLDCAGSNIDHLLSVPLDRLRVSILISWNEKQAKLRHLCKLRYKLKSHDRSYVLLVVSTVATTNLIRSWFKFWFFKKLTGSDLRNFSTLKLTLVSQSFYCESTLLTSWQPKPRLSPKTLSPASQHQDSISYERRGWKYPCRLESFEPAFS